MHYYVVLLLVLVIFIVLTFFVPISSRVSDISSLWTGSKRPEQTTEQTTEQQEVQTGPCEPDERRMCEDADGRNGFNICENGNFSEACYMAKISDCVIDSSAASAICCRTGDGFVFECSRINMFTPGMYIITKVDFQKAAQLAGLGWDSYKVCGFSRLIKATSKIPESYRGTVVQQYGENSVGCSSLLSSNRLHEGTADGFIPAVSGRQTLIEWRAFPAGTNLSSVVNAFRYYDLSLPLFSFEVNVGG